ncbi:prion-inhibition and propagation-domain-containing protein, partial [Diaporthe sp. PMI_573]
MEVASLGLGIVTLAGVLKDAIDLFSMFCVARSQREDYALLETKLDVEKVLLLYWAKDVGLDQPFFERLDKRLKDEELLGHVIKIVVKIRELLNKSETLQNEYGVRKKDDTRDINALPPSCAMSESRLAEFNDGICRLIRSMKNTKRLSPKLSPLSRVRWVVRDKVKFENLIRDVNDLRMALFDLVPRLSPGGTFVMAQQDFSRGDGRDRWNRANFELVRDATSIDEAIRRDDRQVRNIHSAAILSLENRRYEMVLKSLEFPEMQARERNIAKAHPSTMKWALRPPKTGNIRWDDLPEWLRAGTGIYWVRGKAGSGKSTLMKYLIHHELFKRNLDHWVPGGSCVLAGFFFLRLGNRYQNSMAGLLRSILYQLFRANSDDNLAEAIVPELWEETGLVDAPPTWNPSVNEMIGVAERLAVYDGMNKTCLVVDGLDEYVGDYNDGVRFIKALAKGPNIKLLVSSRPEPKLVDAFRDSRQLGLEDLTAKDIKRYVRHKIESHRYTGDLIRKKPDAVKTLEEIVLRKASGVFLWVVLACRSLLDGFMAVDNLDELRHRLDELPGELDDMFKHMFSRIEPRYRQQGATFLKLCYRQAQQQRHEYGLVTVGLALFDDHGCDPKKMPKPTMLSHKALRDTCRMLEGRLRSRTGGLLEIQHGISPCFCRAEVGSDCIHNHFPDHDHSDSDADTDTDTDAAYNSHDRLTDTSVAFMHRLVYEYLDNDDSWKMAGLQ